MPELPEVETVVHGLEKQLLEVKLTSLEVMQPMLRYPIITQQIEPILHQKIISFSRWGKYFSINFANHYSLLFHLGMSGKLFLSKEKKSSHPIVIFQTETNLYFIFSDMRRFGVLLGLPTKEIASHALIKKLGADALSKEFSKNYLWSKLQKSGRAIKDILMDQQVVAGLGNIYVCELLFRLCLHPQTPANKISLAQSQQIIIETKKLLRFAIRKQGSSVSDYVNSAGEKGGFQFFFSVYQKEHQPCKTCQTPIARIKQNNRSTFFCPHCQSN